MTYGVKLLETEAVLAYSQCPRKAYLIHYTKNKGQPNEYLRIIEEKRKFTQNEYIHNLKNINEDIKIFNPNQLKNKTKYLTKANLISDNLCAVSDLLLRVKGRSSFGNYSYEPILFVGIHTITKEDKLKLFFVGYVLGKYQDNFPKYGRIINANHKSHKVNLDASIKIVTPIINAVHKLIEPPIIIMQKHCSICKYYHLCKTEAESVNSISLLDRISPKLVKKYAEKGIFTVKQLSYCFKPRKRKKHKNKCPILFKPELQALALRTNKIYIQELPEITNHPIKLFIDIEGIPDEKSYYLFGLIISIREKNTYQHFWADTIQDEVNAWKNFTVNLKRYPEAPI